MKDNSQLIPTENHDSQQHEYAFDCKLEAVFRVEAISRADAEKKLRKNFAAACCNGGMWPNGDPILFDARIGESPLLLNRIDGDLVEESAFEHLHVGKLIRNIFAKIEPYDIDAVISRAMMVDPDAYAAREGFEYQMRGVGCIDSSAVINPEYASVSGTTVGGVQEVLSEALTADGITRWPTGTAKFATTSKALYVVNGELLPQTAVSVVGSVQTS
jgi:hypothetical protein